MPKGANGLSRQPPDDDDGNSPAGLSESEQATLDDAAWAAYWGWDCYGPAGLLERVYGSLGLPQRAWHGLKACPEAGGLSEGDLEKRLQLVQIKPPPKIRLHVRDPGVFPNIEVVMSLVITGESTHDADMHSVN